MTPSPDPVKVRLSGLPEAAPPPALRQRVAHARYRRRRAVHATATAACVALAALFLVPLTHRSVVEPPGTVPVASTLPAGAASTPPPVVGRVQAIDRRLQAAYDRGASAAEIALLWQERAALQRAGSQPAMQPTRI